MHADVSAAVALAAVVSASESGKPVRVLRSGADANRAQR